MTRARSNFHLPAGLHPTRMVPAILVLISLIVAVVQIPAPAADAAGPPYDGPVTQATGPAYFGPAPNAFPYCENPTYFDPLPENVNPIGRIDPTGSPNASVTTNGVTLEFELTAEGNPGTQYPGFFPANGDGGPGDQPKGVEMASDDAATITLSQPLFYTQWIFTDVDRANEGFFVTPAWTSAPGQIAVFGGDPNFTFDGTTTTTAVFNDTDTVSQDSEAIEGRVQVDMLGAVTGIDLVRDTGNGQSGFAIGGGCEPLGVAKSVSSGPTWNAAVGAFDVEYTISVRNNLPSAATIGADINAAIDAATAAGGIGFTTGDPIGIDMTGVTLQDLLVDSAFSSISVELLENTSGQVAVNDGYNGDTDIDIIAAGETIAPETAETFTLQLRYTPAPAGDLDPTTCATPYSLENQAEAGGTADGVAVTDLSDAGTDPDPGVDNGDGGVNDPTIVTFDCPPPPADANLALVKTVVAGPAGACPDFAGGVSGQGTPLDVDLGDTVTYCITVQNPSTVDITDVVITDPQAPATFDGAVGTLAPNGEATVQFDLVVDASTPTTNTATANGTGPTGPVPEVSDPAGINPLAPPAGGLAIVKTVVAGPGGTCPDFAGGVAGAGTPLDVTIGDTVTYCITVQNPSAVDITEVSVTDDQAPATFDGAVGTLAPNGEATVQFDLVIDATTPTTNTASATGIGPAGPLPEVSDPAVINPIAQPDGSLGLVKTSVAGPNGTCPDFATGVAGAGDPLPLILGDTVTYCITVQNSSTVDVTDIVVSDPQAPASFDGAIGTLAPGAEATVQFDLVVGPDTPTTNTATATGVGPNGPLPEVDDPAGIDPGQPNASIVLSKTVIASGDCSSAVEGTDEFVLGVTGDAITWCFVVTNTGEIPLTDLVFTDTPAGVIDRDLSAELPGPTLGVGESYSFALPGTIPENGVDNVASVVGAPSDPTGTAIPGTNLVTDENDAAINETSVDFVKTVIAGPAGDCATADDLAVVNKDTTVTYCFTITNTGGVALQVTEVNDTTLDVIVPIPAGQQILAPGASVTVSIDAAATDDLVNTASIDATPVTPDGTPIPDAPPLNPNDPAEVEVLTADLSLIKKVNVFVAEAGQILSYTIEITNAGPDPAEDVKFIDTLPDGLIFHRAPSAPGWTCTILGPVALECLRAEPLAAGESDELDYSVEMTTAAPFDTNLVNTAETTSSTPDPDPTNNRDIEEVTRLPITDAPVPPEGPPPFTQPPAPPVPKVTPPAPTPVLAFSGVTSWLTVTIALSMSMLGGVMVVGGRRRTEDEADA